MAWSQGPHEQSTWIVVVTIGTIATLDAQDTLDAVNLSVSATVDRGDGNGAVPATITAWSWKIDGLTTGIAGPTTETPTYTPTTSGVRVASVDVTIEGVVYPSSLRTFEIGREGWILLEDVDLTAGEIQDLTAIVSGDPFVVDGATRSITRSGTIVSCTVGGGTGLLVSFNGSGAYISVRRTFANLIPGYGIEDDVMVLYRRAAGRTTNTNHVDRIGWFGVRELGCEAKHTEGARLATKFGGWVYGAANGIDPTIIGYRRRGRDFTALSSAAGAGAGWPAFSSLTKVGYAGLLQDGNDTEALATSDTVDLFVTQGIIATARSNAEFTQQSIWVRR